MSGAPSGALPVYRLRQVAWVAADLEAAVAAIAGPLGLEVCYRDPEVHKWGLVNAVLPVGGEFLEIVSPSRAGTSAGRYLDRRGGDGGYMVILHTADALAERQRIAGLGVRIAWNTDRPDYKATHLHPADCGQVLLSIDSTDAGAAFHAEAAAWPPGGPHWQRHVRREVVEALAGVELQSADPAAQAAAWGRALALPAEARDGIPRIAFCNGEARFVRAEDGRGPGLRAIDLRAGARARAGLSLELAGLHVNLV